MLNLLLLPALLAGIISFLFTPVVIKLGNYLGIIDDPKLSSHPKVIHTYPVARGGGIPILAGVVFASLAFLPLDKHLAGILLGALGVALVGFLDDKYNLSPYLRIILGFLAASIPILAGVGIAFISNPLGGTLDLSYPQIAINFLGQAHTIWLVSDLFALFWIVFMMNMLNMGAKGVDGQLPGVVAIAAATIAVLTLKFSGDITQWPVIILAGAVGGAYLGFLPWNFYPQKIMPGYGGSTLAGYFLAVASILSTTKVGTLLVVLGVPLIDTGYVIITRLLSGKSPVWGDTGHLHHRLLAKGLSKKQVAIFYWIFTGVLGLLALSLNTTFKFYTMVGTAFGVGGLILWLTYRSR